MSTIASVELLGGNVWSEYHVFYLPKRASCGKGLFLEHVQGRRAARCMR